MLYGVPSIEYPCGAWASYLYEEQEHRSRYIYKVGLRSNPDVQVETHKFYERTISCSILGGSLVEKSVSFD